MTEIIGRGEKTALAILKEIYGERDDIEYFTQYKFKDLLKGEWVDTVTERQEKETIDIVVKTPRKTLAVRIQDPHHNGRITEMRDKVQRKTLEWNEVAVVDLWFHESPELFKEKLNDQSRNEVVTILKSLGVYP